MKKRTLVLVLSIAIIAVATLGATLAYFTDKEEDTNTFTIGNVNIELTEPSWTEDVSDVYPGQVLAKDPIVKNIGNNPCLVRIKLEMPTLPTNLPQNDVAIVYRTGGLDGILGADWVDGGDGYYYYLEILENSESTSELFEEVVIPTELENGDGTTDYDIKVTAYAVQAQGISNYDDLLDGIEETSELPTVQAWFTTVTPPTP